MMASSTATSGCLPAFILPAVVSGHRSSCWSIRPIERKDGLFRRYRKIKTWRAVLPQDQSTAESSVPNASSQTDISNQSQVKSESSTQETGGVVEGEQYDKSQLQTDILATLGWIALAAGAAFGINQWKGTVASLQFVTAYIVEYSLSVDNLFVFLLIFEYFKVPRKSQTRVLSFGIWSAVVFRGVMILAGEALTHRFRGVTLLFAGILLFSAAKIVFSGGEDDEDMSQSGVVKFASRLLPFTDHYDGDRFFTKVNNENLATPLMLVLLSIELSDLVFALDSVPAVLGISDDALVIYLSNILAIAGLRNLFFVLADAIGGLRFLPQALAVVLAFVGGKMAFSVFGYEIGTVKSLAVVVSALGGGIGLSLLFPEKDSKAGKA